MTAPQLYALAGMALVCLGGHALIVHPQLLRKVLAANIMSAGGFLVLAGLGARNIEGNVDPVPQAMVITGIVVAVSASAFALVLIRRVVAATGHESLDPEANHCAAERAAEERR